MRQTNMGLMKGKTPPPSFSLHHITNNFSIKLPKDNLKLYLQQLSLKILKKNKSNYNATCDL